MMKIMVIVFILMLIFAVMLERIYSSIPNSEKTTLVKLIYGVTMFLLIAGVIVMVEPLSEYIMSIFWG